MKNLISLVSVLTIIPFVAEARCPHCNQNEYNYRKTINYQKTVNYTNKETKLIEDRNTNRQKAGVAVQNYGIGSEQNMNVYDNNPYRNYNGCIGRSCGCDENGAYNKYASYEDEANKYTEENRAAEKSKTKSKKTTNYAKLLSPFFHKKGFYSVSEYEHNNYKVNWKALYDSSLVAIDPYEMQWDSKVNNFSEEIGFGLTDRFSIFGSYTYSKNDYKLKDLGYNGTYRYITTSPYEYTDDDKQDNYLFGLSFIPYEDEDIITRVIGGYASQENADYFYVDARLGFKLDPAILYIKGNGYFISYDEDAPRGLGLSSSTDAWAVFFEDGKSSTYWEGSLGAFFDMGSGFTLNVSGTYADYDWHKVMFGRAELGYQIGKHFAMYLFGKYVFDDDADGANFWLAKYDSGTSTWSDYDLIEWNDTKDYSFGGGIKLYF